MSVFFAKSHKCDASCPAGGLEVSKSRDFSASLNRGQTIKATVLQEAPNSTVHSELGAP